MPSERKNWHFGVLSFTGTGHLNSLIPLAQGLKDRGHKVTFFREAQDRRPSAAGGARFHSDRGGKFLFQRADESQRFGSTVPASPAFDSIWNVSSAT